MRLPLWLLGVCALCSSALGADAVQTFSAKGVVKEIRPNDGMVVIRHEAISNYMAAMTMPFKVKVPGETNGLESGDEVSFRLVVTENESWIENILKVGRTEPGTNSTTAAQAPPNEQTVRRRAILDYPFTNELGQAMSLNQFKGQALAITFFFTRCPIPDFCPRLSKNFAEASRKLSAMTNGPANWHFLSVTFDPEIDTPAVLRTYAIQYRYDPAKWSFLTGPTNKIAELAHGAGVKFDPDGSFFNHNFRTLIIDASGKLQMSFPIGGDLSDAITEEIIKAAAVTNRMMP